MLINKLSLLALLILSLTACSNAVTYHHSERSSIALEARSTDPQQPLQGNIGVKTRTIVVTPGIQNNPTLAGFSATGESTSVISDFKLDRDPKGVWQFGSTKIQSAFITGEAAKHAPANSAAALGGLGIDAIGDEATFKREVMKDIYRQLDNIKAKDAKAQEHIERLDALAALLPEDYKTVIYYSLSGGVLQQKDMAAYRPKPSKFLEVINYEETLLSTSINNLKEMVNDRTVKYKTTGNPAADITSQDLKTLLDEQKRLEQARQSFFNLIGNHNAIDMAAAYAISSL